MSLVKNAAVPAGSRLYFDKYFNSITLLKDLYKQNFGRTGTLRSNRLKQCPLEEEIHIKTELGSVSYSSNLPSNVSCCMDQQQKSNCRKQLL
jgi:hypothetical protein